MLVRVAQLKPWGEAVCGSKAPTEIALVGKGSPGSRTSKLVLDPSIWQELVTALPEVPFRAALTLLSLFG